MATHDRPYFEGQRDRDRERERGYRERERSFGRRDSGRRDEDDDDRGSWMSRDRDESESQRSWRDRDPFDPREEGFRGRRSFEDYDLRGGRQSAGGRQRFEQLEDWERPREQQQREFGSQREYESEGMRRGGFGGSPQSLPGYRGGYTGYEDAGRSFSMGRSAWEQRGHESQSQRGFGRFAGRGPKGYQRSDERLKEDLCERLTAASDIDAAEIEVLVQSGEVTLQGSVPDRSMKRAAEDTAEEISGVQQVHNRLRVDARQGEEGEHGSDRSLAKGSEGQRSSAGRKAH